MMCLCIWKIICSLVAETGVIEADEVAEVVVEMVETVEMDTIHNMCCVM